MAVSTLQYSELYKACEAPITHSTVLNQLDAVQSLAEDIPGGLPSSLRSYVIAVRDISKDNSEAFLASWRKKLKSPPLNLTADTVEHLYILVYTMLFIQLFALNDYAEVFYGIYTKLMSLFCLV